MTVRIDNSGVDKFGEAFPVIFAILVRPFWKLL